MVDDYDGFGEIAIYEENDVDDENLETFESLDDLLAQSAVDDDDLELLGLEKKLMEGKMTSTGAHNFLYAGPAAESLPKTKSTASGVDKSIEDGGAPSKEAAKHEKGRSMSRWDEESDKLQNQINELKWAQQLTETDAAPSTDDLLELIQELETQNTSLREENTNLQDQVDHWKDETVPGKQSDTMRTSENMAELLDRIRSLESTNRRLQDGYSQLQDLLAQAREVSNAHVKTIATLRAQLSAATAENPEIIRHHPFLMDEKIVSSKTGTPSPDAKLEDHLQSPGEGQAPNCLSIRKVTSEDEAREKSIRLHEMENTVHNLQERIMVLVQDKLDLQTALDSLQHEDKEREHSISDKRGKDGVVGWFSPSPEKKKSLLEEESDDVKDDVQEFLSDEKSSKDKEEVKNNGGRGLSWFSPSRKEKVLLSKEPTRSPGASDQAKTAEGSNGHLITEGSPAETQADILKAAVEQTRENSFAGRLSGLFGGKSKLPPGSNGVVGECSKPADSTSVAAKSRHDENENTQDEDIEVRTASSEELDGIIEDFAADRTKSESTKASWSGSVNLVTEKEDVANGSHPPPLAFEDLSSMLGSDEFHPKRNDFQPTKNDDDEDEIVDFEKLSSTPISGNLFESSSAKQLVNDKGSISMDTEGSDELDKSNENA